MKSGTAFFKILVLTLVLLLGISRSMKSSLARKTSITLPEKLEGELKFLADLEHRTLSGLLQEAARCYLSIKKWESLQEELVPKRKLLEIRNEGDVDRIIHQYRRS